MIITKMTVTSSIDMEPVAPARVLAAEDCADTQMLLQAILADNDITLTFAESGEECLELAAAAHEHGEAFDLILLDLVMPEPDGYTVARILRGSGFKNPIISMTASCFPGQAEESAASGCTRHLQKSGMHRTLPPLIEELLTPRGLTA